MEIGGDKMIDWSKAREQVAATFFNDTVEICPLESREDDIGQVFQDIGTPVGEYPCNIEYQNISKAMKEPGIETPQYARVSLSKDVPLVRGNQYVLRIVLARVQFDPQEYWEVNDWIEGQISTVLNIKRRETV